LSVKAVSQRQIELPGIGPLLLVKRRGSKHIRLSVTARGEIRVSLPNWAPYASGIYFARSRTDWLKGQVSAQKPTLMQEGDRIGKAHRLHFHFRPGKNVVFAKVSSGSIRITTSLSSNSDRVQAKAIAASEKALRAEAEKLLPQRLKSISEQYDFGDYEVRIRKLTSRWGSCSDQKVITLSYFLVQLPWRLIDYVLVHELTHTLHLHHGSDFWASMKEILPDVARLRKEIKAYKPRVEPLPLGHVDVR